LEVVQASKKRLEDRIKLSIRLTAGEIKGAIVLPAPHRGCHATEVKEDGLDIEELTNRVAGLEKDPDDEEAKDEAERAHGLFAQASKELAECMQISVECDPCVRDAIKMAIGFWRNVLLKKPCASDNDGHDADYVSLKEFAKSHLYLKMPFYGKALDVNVFGIYVPFTSSSVQKTNNNAGGIVSLKNDARPYVCIPKDFEEVLKIYKEEVEVKSRSRSRSGTRTRTHDAGVSLTKLENIKYSQPVPLLHDTFLQALQVEKEVFEPDILAVNAQREIELSKRPEGSKVVSIGDFRKACRDKDIGEFLGPLGTIVYFAVFGGSAEMPLQAVYDLNLLKVMRHAFLDCIAETSKKVQAKIHSSNAVLLDQYTDVFNTGRRYFAGAKCAKLGGARRRRRVEDDSDDGDDDDSDDEA
jgi:hypothetical protein